MNSKNEKEVSGPQFSGILAQVDKVADEVIKQPLSPEFLSYLKNLKRINSGDFGSFSFYEKSILAVFYHRKKILEKLFNRAKELHAETLSINSQIDAALSKYHRHIKDGEIEKCPEAVADVPHLRSRLGAINQELSEIPPQIESMIARKSVDVSGIRDLLKIAKQQLEQQEIRANYICGQNQSFNGMGTTYLAQVNSMLKNSV